MRLLFALGQAAVLGLCGCRGPTEAWVDPRPQSEQVGQAIVVGGERIAIGAPVVLWHEAPYYSAYDTLPRFSDEGPRGRRYAPGRVPAEGGRTRADAERAVDQLVLHYDACGLSSTCFRVLHDERKLSAHFLLDVDGTLYQTLDLADTAWHARQANGRSVGVEIANLGAHAPGDGSPFERWTTEDGRGLRISIPPQLGDGGVRTPDFVARPARPGRITGTVQGETLEQIDLTPEQYESLAKLTAALVQTFPALELRVPEGPDGRVATERIDEELEADFRGILGHLHVSSSKLDPGPAFDWRRYLTRAAQLL